MSLNLWALPKDKVLRAALLKLDQRFGSRRFTLSDRRCDHPGAVVICKPDQPDVLAYLYTFGQEAGCFGLHLEYPRFADTPAPTQDVYENLSFERLADLLRTHFDIA